MFSKYYKYIQWPLTIHQAFIWLRQLRQHWVQSFFTVLEHYGNSHRNKNNEHVFMRFKCNITAMIAQLVTHFYEIDVIIRSCSSQYDNRSTLLAYILYTRDSFAKWLLLDARNWGFPLYKEGRDLFSWKIIVLICFSIKTLSYLFRELVLCEKIDTDVARCSWKLDFGTTISMENWDKILLNTRLS